MLTNDIVSFEQPSPDQLVKICKSTGQTCQICHMYVVNTLLCVISKTIYGHFLGLARKTKFQVLGFNVGLRYRKSSAREETSRCQQQIKTA